MTLREALTIYLNKKYKSNLFEMGKIIKMKFNINRLLIEHSFILLDS